MREYKIYLTSKASVMRTIEADSYDEAVDMAYRDYRNPVPCHQEEYDLSGDWEVDDESSDPDYDENIAKAREAYKKRVADLIRENSDLDAYGLAELLASKAMLRMPH